jgi:hypothetical protein
MKARRCHGSKYNDDPDKPKVVSTRQKRSRQQLIDRNTFAQLAALPEKKKKTSPDLGADSDGGAGTAPSCPRVHPPLPPPPPLHLIIILLPPPPCPPCGSRLRMGLLWLQKFACWRRRREPRAPGTQANRRKNVAKLKGFGGRKPAWIKDEQELFDGFKNKRDDGLKVPAKFVRAHFKQILKKNHPAGTPMHDKAFRFKTSSGWLYLGY